MLERVNDRIKAEFATLSAGMQIVATYVLEHPADVALLSMREQARRAGVQPATMTRFAQRLGYAGYDEIRDSFAASMRGRPIDFRARADELAARREQVGEPTLTRDLAEALVERVAVVRDPDRIEAIAGAVPVLSKARRILCLGHRSCYSPAFHFAYVAGLYGAPTWLLDAPGGVGADALSEAGPADSMLAISFAPYTRSTIEIADSARANGVRVVAITDRAASPLARIAERTITVPADLTGLMHVASPAFAVAEMLAALVVAGAGSEGRNALERNEAEFVRRQVYWSEAAGGAA
jgi:DNA-binding MurR/RpiR family transcriptional regulator